MKFTSLTQRFAVWFTLVSLLPILFIGNSLLHTFETEIKEAAIQKVSAIADKKVEQIDSYLLERLSDVYLVSGMNTTHEAIIKLTAAFEQYGVDSDEYRRLDANYRESFKRFLDYARYYDLFLISTQGTIVYSQAHESDFATNLRTDRSRHICRSKIKLGTIAGKKRSMPSTFFLT